MKKLAILLVCLLLLTGCAQEPVLETVNDEILQPVMTQVYSPVFTLPRDAAVTTMESPDAGTIYFCDGYTVTCAHSPGEIWIEPLWIPPAFLRRISPC